MASGLYSQHVNNKKMLYLRNTIIILMLVTLAVCCLFPLFYMIVNSFGPAVEAASSNRSVFPTSWSLDSYKAFFSFSEYSVCRVQVFLSEPFYMPWTKNEIPLSFWINLYPKRLTHF